MTALVSAVARNAEHGFSKGRVAEINVLTWLGVEGDAHQGVTVRHRSRVAVDPSQPKPPSNPSHPCRAVQ